jgi:hypothetical protein
MFPSDYVENWGSKFGIGLGPVPISEALVNDYHRAPVGESDTGMHALSVCRAQVDLVDVTEEEFVENEAILDIDDTGMRRRAPLMRAKQLMKSTVMMNKFPQSVEGAKALLADFKSQKDIRKAAIAKAK